jgi:hypothetical protein
VGDRRSDVTNPHPFLPVDEGDDPRCDEERDGSDHPRERFLFRGAISVKEE